MDGEPRILRGARALVVLIMSVEAACATRTGSTAPAPAAVAASPSSDPGFDAARGSPHSSPTPGAAPLPDAPSRDRGRLTLKRALEGMGGAGVVDRVRSFVLTGKTTRYLGTEGLTLELPVVTTIVFPRWYRQDLLGPTGTLSTILGPDGAYLVGEPGRPPVPIPGQQVSEIETALMRNPLALLKTRRDATFEVVESAPAPDTAVGQMIVLSGGESTLVSLEATTGRIVRIEYETRAPTGEKGVKLDIAYSDFREVNGLVYAFHISGVRNGQPVFVTQLEEVDVNKSVDPALFRVGP